MVSNARLITGVLDEATSPFCWRVAEHSWPRPLQILLILLLGLFVISQAMAQPPAVPQGDVIPRDVREIYQRGLEFLSKDSSSDNQSSYYSVGGNGLTLLAFLASGDDPNFGQYRDQIRGCIRDLITAQNSDTGYVGQSMYEHGFAMLALAEAYGAIDESDLWAENRATKPTVNSRGRATGNKSGKRSIGQALELAVRTAVTSQVKNPLHAWRYSPTARDADTSVTGAVLMGLLAARNAGIEVPDKSIDEAVKYMSSMTGDNGSVGYSGGMGGFGESIARSSIASLVFSIAKRKDLKQFEATKGYLLANLFETSNYEEYARYYEAQALFQADLEGWEKWNRTTIRQLKTAQNENGSFDGSFGPEVATAMNLLALALNYRFLPIYER